MRGVRGEGGGCCGWVAIDQLNSISQLAPRRAQALNKITEYFARSFAQIRFAHSRHERVHRAECNNAFESNLQIKLIAFGLQIAHFPVHIKCIRPIDARTDALAVVKQTFVQQLLGICFGSKIFVK